MTRSTRAGSCPSTALLRQVVDLARLAPSVHNTQPWTWRIDGDLLELWADRRRRLAVADPLGRNLMISCGTALHHGAFAARALGLQPRVERFPDPAMPDLVARVTLARGVVPPSAGENLDLAVLRDRCTDRRRFTSWPVPDARLEELAATVTHDGVSAVPVTDVSVRFRIELMMERARRTQDADPRYADEAARWMDRKGVDGIPALALPPRHGATVGRPHRFAAQAEPTQRILESSEGLVVLVTGSDDPPSWAGTGEALSALWLRAAREGLSVVPLSQLVEDSSTRSELTRELAEHGGHPQILVRVGWQEISRSTLFRTPRRPLDDVLRE